MADPTMNPAQMVIANLKIESDTFQMQARVPIPAGPTSVGELLPLARGLSDAVVRATNKTVEERGAKISCKKGCGACCRNLVTISEIEARRLRVVVENLPEPRRAELRARFADARQRLEKAGLLDTLLHAEKWTAKEYAALVGVYFQQGIACPFLEDESCSIYEERPITCREYLVVSPPEHCDKVGSVGVQRVQLPLRVFNAVARWQTPPAEHLNERVVPLILVLEWAEAHPNDPPPRPGPELVSELLDLLKDKSEPIRARRPAE